MTLGYIYMMYPWKYIFQKYAYGKQIPPKMNLVTFSAWTTDNCAPFGETHVEIQEYLHDHTRENFQTFRA